MEDVQRSAANIKEMFTMVAAKDPFSFLCLMQYSIIYMCKILIKQPVDCNQLVELASPKGKVSSQPNSNETFENS